MADGKASSHLHRFLLPFESAIQMLTLRVWVGLSLLLTTALGSPLDEVDSVLQKRGGVVGTGYASYQGVVTYGDVTSYLGVPYAEPPLGDLRFRAPKPLDVARVARETGGKVVDATQYPNFCVQGPLFRGDRAGAGSEDCLKVNIYTPSGASAGSNLPVLFYIHGGGYIFGNPATLPYDPWVHQSQQVVIVSVYYRLATFGFLSHPDFASGTIADHNVGFLDQVQALKWVKNYIYYFGGDPERITIDGESAGGSSVLLHLVSTGEKVFKQAISQSLYRTPLPTPDQQKGLFDYFTSLAGCNTGNTTTTVACLRQASLSTLAIAQDAAMGTYSGAYYQFKVVLDGKVITDYPDRLLLQGKYTQVPLITGQIANETLATNSAGDIFAALHSYIPLATDSDIQDWINTYSSEVWSSQEERFRTITGDASVRCSTIVADAEKSVGAWTYKWVTPVPGSPFAEHATENWYQFLGWNLGLNGTATYQNQTAAERAFAEETIAYWLSFVRSGDPNKYKLSRSPNWPKYTTFSPSRILLAQSNDTTKSQSSVELIPIREILRCALLGGRSDITQA
ncbi:alpha/beta-hydrolase [Thelephora ganbajun]|uniref:Alpha/beta-hydrolase n=1 Tax=Thelephora ganbajun TaxID=370292 RepID=A0ACB6ZE16_THEGA|nr:alpha/beta-hydrolase [Thelephora ganbajun]